MVYMIHFCMIERVYYYSDNVVRFELGNMVTCWCKVGLPLVPTSVLICIYIYVSLD